MVVKIQFWAADLLISSMRMALLKNKERKNHFEIIKTQPDVIVTRWSSWLRAAIYYAIIYHWYLRFSEENLMMMDCWYQGLNLPLKTQFYI
jgi:hypothetical protein